jgi:hypothetical protein
MHILKAKDIFIQEGSNRETSSPVMHLPLIAIGSILQNPFLYLLQELPGPMVMNVVI